MSPEWLLEAGLLLVALLAGAVAISLFVSRQRALALRLVVVSFAFIAAAVVLGRSERRHTALRRIPSQAKALTPFETKPAADRASDENVSHATASTSLILGNVVVEVAAATRYVLSVDDEDFLTLDTDSSGLMVACEVAGSNDRLVARVQRNIFFEYDLAGIRTSRPDPHTLVATEQGGQILRIRYAAPRTIEAAGRFYVSNAVEPVVISPTTGVHWRGGGLQPGSNIDLRPQGRGRIDFERSGLIQVRPK